MNTIWIYEIIVVNNNFDHSPPAYFIFYNSRLQFMQ